MGHTRALQACHGSSSSGRPGAKTKPPPRQGCVFTRIPYLADRSAGFGTLRSRERRLPGFTGPSPSTHLDKAALFSCGARIYGIPGSLVKGIRLARSDPPLTVRVHDLCRAKYARSARSGVPCAARRVSTGSRQAKRFASGSSTSKGIVLISVHRSSGIGVVT